MQNPNTTALCSRLCCQRPTFAARLLHTKSFRILCHSAIPQGCPKNLVRQRATLLSRFPGGLRRSSRTGSLCCPSYRRSSFGKRYFPNRRKRGMFPSNSSVQGWKRIRAARHFLNVLCRHARGPFFRRHIPDIPAFNGRLAVKRYRLNEGFPAQSGLQRFLFGGSHCSVPSMYAAVTASSWRCKSSASVWYSSARWLAPSSWHCRRSASAR